ncbi:MAG: hypothetical protein QXS54_08825 [Candidatus Methanomethylicaceae archaeon]
MAAQQPSVNMQSVQVTYRIFSRDMFPGWLFSLWTTYLLAPNLFSNDTLIIFTAIASFIWSPIVGLLINAAGYILLGWLLENKVADFIFGIFFRKENRTIYNYVATFAKMIEIEKDEQLAKFREELFDRLTFIIRTSGWSDKDEVVERIRGIHQTARTLSFVSALLTIVDGSRLIVIHTSNPFFLRSWQITLPLAFVFLFLAWFLNEYARLTELHLLYELISLKHLPVSIIKSNEKAPNTA